jgi:hypothetical protein
MNYLLEKSLLFLPFGSSVRNRSTVNPTVEGEELMNRQAQSLFSSNHCVHESTFRPVHLSPKKSWKLNIKAKTSFGDSESFLHIQPTLRHPMIGEVLCVSELVGLGLEDQGCGEESKCLASKTCVLKTHLDSPHCKATRGSENRMKRCLWIAKQIPKTLPLHQSSQPLLDLAYDSKPRRASFQSSVNPRLKARRA